MLESNLISRIRHIFLQPRPHVSIMQAEGLLGWTRRQMALPGSVVILSPDSKAASLLRENRITIPA